MATTLKILLTPEVQDPSSPTQKHLSRQHFVHKPLHSSRQEIRLLILHPSCQSETLSGSIMHVSLSSRPKYEALSYCCGDPAPSHKINLDGQDFPIASNLSEALRAIRHKAKPRIMWVDAICISDDVEERSKQILLMHTIYTNTSRVLAWVGPAGKGTKHLLQVASKLAHRPVSEEEVFRLSREWDALAELFRRPYWSRIWIIQELALNPNVLLVCGHSRCPYAAIEKLQALIRRYRESLSLYREEFYVFGGDRSEVILNALPASIAGLREELCRRRQEYQFNFHEIVDKYRSSRSTDPRDKIYGLRGLVPDSVADIILPDYTQSAQDIYTDLTITAISKTNSLNIICGSQNARTLKDLPSWVPDFSVPYKPVSLRELSEVDPYNASKNTKANAKFSSDRKVLTVQAVLFEEVVAKSDPGEYGGENIDRNMDGSRLSDEAKPGVKGSRGINPKNGKPTYAPRVMIDFVVHHSRLRLKTRDARSGFGPLGMEEGDRICILLGCFVPLVVRQRKDHFILVGEAFVQGCMEGEIMDQVAAGKLSVQEICLR